MGGIPSGEHCTVPFQVTRCQPLPNVCSWARSSHSNPNFPCPPRVKWFCPCFIDTWNKTHSPHCDERATVVT